MRTNKTPFLKKLFEKLSMPTTTKKTIRFISASNAKIRYSPTKLTNIFKKPNITTSSKVKKLRFLRSAFFQIEKDLA